MTTRDTETKRSRPRKVLKTNLQYPIFKEMADLITDQIWNKTYLEMSNGHFPITGLWIQDNRLVYRSRGQKKNKFEVEIPDNAMEAIPIITDFLYEKLSINRGNNQVDIQNYLIEHMKDELPKWNKLKRLQKIDIVIRYAKQLKEKYNLETQTYNHLKNTLINAVEDYTLRNNDIIMEDGAIKNINSLTFDPENNYFKLTKFRKTNKKSIKIDENYNLLDRLKIVLMYSSNAQSLDTETSRAIETGISTN